MHLSLLLLYLHHSAGFTAGNPEAKRRANIAVVHQFEDVQRRVEINVLVVNDVQRDRDFVSRAVCIDNLSHVG